MHEKSVVKFLIDAQVFVGEPFRIFKSDSFRVAEQVGIAPVRDCGVGRFG